MADDNKRDESTCGHFNLAPYGCEHCFMSHEEIAAERDASISPGDGGGNLTRGNQQ
jgi:hypothetical protein